MTKSSRTPRAAVRALVVLVLILPMLIAVPAAAQDVISREAESTVVLRDGKKVSSVTVTIEVRLLTVDDEFLERVGVDFGGAVTGLVANNDQPVEKAKLIVELFKVENDGGTPSVVRVGREKVATDAGGEFRIPMRDLVDADTRKKIEDGEIAALRIEATGKNAKKVDLVRLAANTTLGGLIQ